MGLFTKFRNAVAGVFSNLSNPAKWFTSWLNQGTETDSGVDLTESNVIGWAPVWYAVSRIAGHVSTLPLSPMRRLDRGAEVDRRHRAFYLVRTRPNEYMSASQFWETYMAHALLYGNGKAAILRDGGRVTELLLIHPAKSVTVYIDGQKWHAVQISGSEDDPLVAKGGTENSSMFNDKDWIKIPDVDVLHLPGLGLDGIGGMQLFDVSRNTFGIGIAAEKAVSADFANGSSPGVILQAPQGVLKNDKDAKEFIENFNRYHSGVDKRSRTGLLRDGITATTLEKSNRDAEWLGQRTFQRQEVALLFGLESILGDDASVAYKSAEQKDLAYHKNTLAKWLVKIEQECDFKLLTNQQKLLSTHYFKFDTSVLLRTDYKSTMDALSIAIQSRILSPNEAREKLDMNPYDGGDEYENPAITPGNGNGDDTSEDDVEPSPQDANRMALVNHLQHLIGVECQQVMNASRGKGNFISWLDKFYGDRWCATLSRAVDRFGGPKTLAAEYCERSRVELIELTGIVTTEGLVDAVAELVEQWPERAELLAGEILGDSNVPAIHA